MASNELLSEIKKAEEDAKKTVTEALRRKEYLISESNKKSRKIIEDGNVESQKALQETLRVGNLELETKKNNIIVEGVSQSDSLAVKSKSNIPRAVEYLVLEFEKEIRL